MPPLRRTPGMVNSAASTEPETEGETGPAGSAITWLGHATVLIELDGVRLLTDPLLRSRLGPLRRMAAPVSPDVIQGVDAVLLSHLHADHADPGSLRRLGPELLVVAPLGAGSWVQRRGRSNVRELAPGATTQVGPLTIGSTPADHDGRRHRFAPEAEAIGFVVRGSRAVYFAGDTDIFPAIGNLGVPIDVALLPVGGWGPTLGPGHLDPGRAAEAARLIGPRLAIPIHWGTLALPWPAARVPGHASAGQEFASCVADVAPEVEVRVLAPGERTGLA